MDVERWIRQAQAGDAEAFNRLVLTFQDLCFHVALQHSNGSDDEALDACQDAMLSAWRAVGRFEGDARGFRAWLLRIVVNACRDRRRYDRRRPQQPIEIEQDGERRVMPLPDPGQSPDDYAQNEDLKALLEWALGRLSEDHRSVIALDQAGFNYAQMAEILGVEVGTIKSRLSRARLQMRDILRGAGAERPGAPAYDAGLPNRPAAGRSSTASPPSRGPESAGEEPRSSPGRSLDVPPHPAGPTD